MTPRIDAHQHYWRYDPAEYGWIDDSMASLRRDFLPADAWREMQRTGVQRAVAVQARQTLEETSWLLALADESSFIAGVVGWVDLQAADVAWTLATLCRKRKLVGIRHIVQAEPDERFLLRPEFCRGIAALAQFDLAYDILVYPRHLSVAAEFALRFPEQRFVLDHCGKPDLQGGDLRRWEVDLRRLAGLPQVWCKVSGLVTEADWRSWTPAQLARCLDIVFDAFGPERIMVGSDWPVCTVAGDYARVMKVFTDYVQDLPAAEQEAVLGGNAAHFWRLDAEGS